MKPIIRDKNWRHITQARVGLSRIGHAVSTKDYLKLRYARIKAVNAIYHHWDYALLQKRLCHELAEQEVLTVQTQVSTRETYLQRPDLGRKLSADSIASLKNYADQFDIVFIVSDGLSAQAIDTHFFALWQTMKTTLHAFNYRIAPLVLAPFSRVAISDEIGFYLNAKLAVIIVGERPGSSTTDSVGIYLTYDPKPGNNDSGRNCISNIRPPYGLQYQAAAEQLNMLIDASLQQRISGCTLQLIPSPGRLHPLIVSSMVLLSYLFSPDIYFESVLFLL